MNGEERRVKILRWLTESTEPVNATTIAKSFGVTRQIIVADIALLRASGSNIVALHRGYILKKPETYGGTVKQLVVKHGKNDVRKEFYAITDNGGKIHDVMIEHGIYGALSAKLSITTRYEADEFIDTLNRTGSSPLSELTDGLHVHTVSTEDPANMDRIIKKLTDLKILVRTN